MNIKATILPTKNELSKELIQARDVMLQVKKQDSRFYWSPEWREFRRLYIEWHGAYCDECHATDNLHLHHHIGHEGLLPGEPTKEGDWRLLCFYCHDDKHNNRMSLQNETALLMQRLREQFFASHQVKQE